MSKNTKGIKNTVSMPGYPVTGPPARDGQPGPTAMSIIGPTPGSAGLGPAVPLPPMTATHSQPRHPAESGGSDTHGKTHSQPKHPAEKR